MLRDGHVASVQVTIRLRRLFGGFWAYKTFALHHDGEVLSCVTDAEGECRLPIVPAPRGWGVVVDGRTLGTFDTKPTDFRIDFVL